MALVMTAPPRSSSGYPQVGLPSLQIANNADMVHLVGKDIPEQQQMREFVHNGLQACATHAKNVAGTDYKPKTLVTSVERNGVPKLAFVDNGCGMTEHQLFELVGSLAASFTRVGDSRFGIGAKVTGLYRNPLGLEYTTGTPGGSFIRATIGLDPVSGQYGWLEMRNVDSLDDEKQLDKDWRKSPNGTLVVLLGREEGDDTFARACGIPIGNKRIVRFLNSRYYSFPDGMSVNGTVYRNASEASTESRVCKGIKHMFDEVPGEHGELTVGGAHIEWFHTAELTAASAKTEVRFNDNFPRLCFVGVRLEDKEVHGLSELYETYTGVSARNLLASFGLSLIASNTALIVTPDSGVASSGRTKVTIGDAGELTWGDWAEGFKENLPAELTQLIQEKASAWNPAMDSTLLTRLSDHSALLTTKGFSSGSATGLLHGSGGQGASNTSDSNGSKSGPGDGMSDKAPSTGGGTGHHSGGHAAPQPGTNNGTGGKLTGVVLPVVQLLTGTEVPEELVDKFASYCEEANSLLVNKDFGGITSEVSAHLHKRGKLSTQDRSAITDLVIQAMTDRVMEAILRSQAMGKTSEAWEDRSDAYGPTALSMAAITSLTGWSETAQAISLRIGKI